MGRFWRLRIKFPELIPAGTSPEVLVTISTTSTGSPRGIAVDKSSDKLFWSDVLNSSISSANRNGASGTGILSSLSHPIGISTNWTSALPVELTTFSAAVVNKTVQLNWETATEVNNYGFEIERNHSSKVGNVNWENIGFVEGHGNSNSPKSYYFIDKGVSKRQYAYRLKQIDSDGKFEYSKEIAVTIENTPTSFELSQNYPNPFNPSTSIRYSIISKQFVQLKVFDELGNEVKTLVNEEKNVGTYEVVWNADILPSGIYYYRLLTDNFNDTKKMLLLK